MRVVDLRAAAPRSFARRSRCAPGARRSSGSAGATFAPLDLLEREVVVEVGLAVDDDLELPPHDVGRDALARGEAAKIERGELCETLRAMRIVSRSKSWPAA